MRPLLLEIALATENDLTNLLSTLLFDRHMPNL
jgi:hypothetical protein